MLPGQDPISEFLSIVSYVSGPYEGGEGYVKLEAEISKAEDEVAGNEGPARRLFYFALPPSVYPPVGKEIHRYCMNKSKHLSFLFHL